MTKRKHDSQLKEDKAYKKKRLEEKLADVEELRRRELANRKEIKRLEKKLAAAEELRIRELAAAEELRIRELAAAEELRIRELAAAEKLRKRGIRIKNLYFQIDAYISSSLSTSSIGSKQSSAKKISPDYVCASNFLSIENIDIKRISSEEWQTFEKSITGVIDTEKSEKSGMHPIIKDLLEGIINSIDDCYYHVNYERTLFNDDRVAKIPDFSISEKSCESLLLSDCVIPIEIKKQGDMESARVQAAGYLLSKLRDKLELIDLKKSHRIFGFCVAISGTEISFGHICIEKRRVKLCFSGPTNFWDGTNR
jgi:hypothetical protein